VIERVHGVCGGDPVIAGTRITVNHIYRLFMGLHKNVNQILADYPYLKRDQVMEAIRYANRHPECQDLSEE
jgi:uncharacterized protein (DUF433 family)